MRDKYDTRRTLRVVLLLECGWLCDLCNPLFASTALYKTLLTEWVRVVLLWRFDLAFYLWKWQWKNFIFLKDMKKKFVEFFGWIIFFCFWWKIFYKTSTLRRCEHVENFKNYRCNCWIIYYGNLVVKKKGKILYFNTLFVIENFLVFCN